MKPFEEIKEELLKRAKEHDACREGYNMGLNAQNKADLLKAITANWRWVLVSKKIVDAQYLEENFTCKELDEAGIYTREVHKISSATVYACGSATVYACGSATVYACGSATVYACGNSYVEDYIGSIRPISDYAIVKDYYSHKIYIKKGKFDIIEIE